MDSKTFKAACLKYLETTDLYKAFGLQKTASEKDVKNAYRRLSLKTHPDRVPDEEKEVATEKFKIVAQIHSILSDPKKRKTYDLTGDIEEDVDADWLDYWRSVFKVITPEDIENHEKEYRGSELERTDIKESYKSCQGDMNKIMDCVPFADLENEDRISDIIKEMIKNEEVEDFDAFSKEKAERKKKRKAKMLRQRKEFEKSQAEKVESEDESFKSLQMALAERNAARNGAGFLEALERKYASGGDKKRSASTKSSRPKRTK